jgi:diguanylate cyclase (GGDEF)-like protein
MANDLSVMAREASRKNRDLKEANKTIERLARTDALTGLANRRTLDEAFDREIARAERLGEPLSVIIADLDHFKSINDQYGHGTGDKVLVHAAVLTKRIRPYDLAVRYGGEEFVLLLPGASNNTALLVAERVRAAMAEMRLDECPRQITASLGVASWIEGEAPEGIRGASRCGALFITPRAQAGTALKSRKVQTRDGRGETGIR